MAGVYFYPAVIKNVVNRSTVSVMFMEDNIVKKVRKETEVVKVSQLLPGHGLTIKHDLYTAYDVTARLKSYPSRRGEELEYRVEIAATDSEPQTNEDCRVVTHNEITLTGDLAARASNEKKVWKMTRSGPPSPIVEFPLFWTGSLNNLSVSFRNF